MLPFTRVGSLITLFGGPGCEPAHTVEPQAATSTTQLLFLTVSPDELSPDSGWLPHSGTPLAPPQAMAYQPAGADPEIIIWAAAMLAWIAFWLMVVMVVRGRRALSPIRFGQPRAIKRSVN